MKLFILLFLLPFTSFSQLEEEEIFDFCEVEPSFPGGSQAMMEFISMNVEYPAESMQKEEQGVVYVQFVVGTTGELEQIVVRRGVSKLLDAEAVRVISKMPNWIPGEQNGKPIKVRFTLPIHFRLT